jgi:release factor glutamine methyltransferase
MNANSLPQTQAIKDWLTIASRQLSDIEVPSASLDAEIILAHAFERDRIYLHTHPEQIISVPQLQIANYGLKERLQRIPIAYIIGHKEFYGREFITTPAVLIPRPESEAVIELLGQILQPMANQQQSIKLIDVGTGSGCLGITAKLEFSNLGVTLADISQIALDIAQKNAIRLSAEVNIIQSDLLQNCIEKPDIIIANLPYVDHNWERSIETNYEPDLALFADNHGLELIERLITQADRLFLQSGHIIIEADPTQHESLIEFASKKSFYVTNRIGYAFTLSRQSQ